MGDIKVGLKVYGNQGLVKSETSPIGGKIHSKLALVNKKSFKSLKMELEKN